MEDETTTAQALDEMQTEHPNTSHNAGPSGIHDRDHARDDEEEEEEEEEEGGSFSVDAIFKLLVAPQERPFYGMNQLETLDLSNNMLVELPRAIRYLNQLKTMDVSSNRLRTVPAEVRFLTQLTSMNLTSNPFLIHLPGELRTLAQCNVRLDPPSATAGSGGFSFSPEFGDRPAERGIEGWIEMQVAPTGSLISSSATPVSLAAGGSTGANPLGLDAASGSQQVAFGVGLSTPFGTEATPTSAAAQQQQQQQQLGPGGIPLVTPNPASSAAKPLFLRRPSGPASLCDLAVPHVFRSSDPDEPVPMEVVERLQKLESSLLVNIRRRVGWCTHCARPVCGTATVSFYRMGPVPSGAQGAQQGNAPTRFLFHYRYCSRKCRIAHEPATV